MLTPPKKNFWSGEKLFIINEFWNQVDNYNSKGAMIFQNFEVPLSRLGHVVEIRTFDGIPLIKLSENGSWTILKERSFQQCIAT